MFGPCVGSCWNAGSCPSWVPWALYAARRVCADPGVHYSMVLADRLRESLLCQVQPPGGSLDEGRTCILLEQGRWFGFSDGKTGGNSSHGDLGKQPTVVSASSAALVSMEQH